MGYTDFGEDEGDQRSGASIGKRLLLELLDKWYWIVLAVIIGGASSAYYLSKAPKIYSSMASLLVKEQTGAVLGKDQTEEINMRSDGAMNTVVERLKRQVLLERVASRDEVRDLEGILPPAVRWLPAIVSDWLGDPEEEPDPAAAKRLPVEELAGRIGSWTIVSVRSGTRLIDIEVSHPSPEVAKVLANAIAQEYVDETSGDKSFGRTNVIGLLGEKSEEARQSLQEAQRALSAYQRALAVHEDLEAKEKQVIELKRRYRAKHPEMITALAQLDGLQNRFLGDLSAVVKSGSDALYWESSGEELDSSLDILSERLEMARRLLLSRTAVLKSEIQSQESVFNAMLTKMQEVDVNQSEDDSSVEINSVALLPGAPVVPVVQKVMMLGLLGGLFAGAGLAYGAISLDNKFHTVMQVEELMGVPVLAAVSTVQAKPKVKKGSEKPPSRKNVEAAEIEKNWDARIIFRQDLEDSIYAEMYRVLRASITLLGAEETRKVTLFTSAIPGEGKTTTSINYALAAAGQGKRVLLIDLDLRRPAVHESFGVIKDSNFKGVTNYLAGTNSFADSIIRNISGNGLDLMAAGMMAPRPGELLNGVLLAKLLAEARAEYDLIVLDTAPLLAVPDTRVIAMHADNVCLVVRAEYVPKGAAKRMLRLLESGRTPIAGVVFNGFRERRSLIGYNYSYGYYKYGSKGKPYGYGGEAYGSESR